MNKNKTSNKNIIQIIGILIIIIGIGVGIWFGLKTKAIKESSTLTKDQVQKNVQDYLSENNKIYVSTYVDTNSLNSVIFTIITIEKQTTWNLVIAPDNNHKAAGNVTLKLKWTTEKTINYNDINSQIYSNSKYKAQKPLRPLTIADFSSLVTKYLKENSWVFTFGSVVAPITAISISDNSKYPIIKTATEIDFSVTYTLGEGITETGIEIKVSGLNQDSSYSDYKDSIILTALATNHITIAPK